jgi:hypothetical protein
MLQPAAESQSSAQPVTVPGLNASISALGFQDPKNFNSVPFTALNGLDP